MIAGKKLLRRKYGLFSVFWAHCIKIGLQSSLCLRFHSFKFFFSDFVPLAQNFSNVPLFRRPLYLAGQLLVVQLEKPVAYYLGRNCFRIIFSFIVFSAKKNVKIREVWKINKKIGNVGTSEHFLGARYNEWITLNIFCCLNGIFRSCDKYMAVEKFLKLRIFVQKIEFLHKTCRHIPRSSVHCANCRV